MKRKTYSWLGFASDWMRRQQFPLIGYYAARGLTKANISLLWFSVRATRSRRKLDISNNRGLAYVRFPERGPYCIIFLRLWIGSFVISSFCDWLDLHT